MTRNRWTRMWMGAALIVALLALTIVTLRVTNHPPSGEAATPSATLPHYFFTSTPVFRAAVETLAPTVTSPTAPIEAWAEELLILIIEHTAYQSTQQPFDVLIVQDTGLYVGPHVVTLDGGMTLRFLLPSNEEPFEPIVGGSIIEEEGVLVLTTREGPRRMVNGGAPSVAFRALMSAAAVERVHLEGAIVNETEASVEVVLVAHSSEESAQTTPTESGHTPLPMLGVITPSPMPDVNLARMVGEQTDTIIDAAPLFHPDAVMRFLESHSRTGALTWTEQGARVGGRPLNIANAETLTLYTLNPNDPSMTTVSFMELSYDEDSWQTALLGDGWFFGHRLEETLYWMVRRAAERDGRLLVAYDDLGAQQAITVIGFRSFEN